MTPISAFQSSSWGLGHQGPKTSPPHCSLLEVTTHRIGEHKESVVALYHWIWGGFLLPSSNQNNEAYSLLIDLHEPNPKTGHFVPSPVEHTVTPRPAELSKAAGDLQEPCYIRSRNQQPQHHLGALRTVPSYAPFQTYWISICILIRFPG